MKQHFLWLRFQQKSFLRLILLNMALLDELTTGFVIVGLPLLRDQSGLSYEQIGLLFSVGALSAMILEPVGDLLSDRSSKRWWVLGGVLGLVCGFALSGSTSNFIVLLVAFALIYPTCGMAVGLSQATLIDSNPAAGTRTMTRWTMMAGIGDLLSPLVVAAFVALGMGWSALCWLAAIVWLAAGVIAWLQPFPCPVALPDDEESATESSILTNLRKAIRDPLLLRWAVLSILPTMLDEIFIGFAALYLHDVLQTSQEMISISIVVEMIGGLLGLVIMDRLLGHISPRRLLVGLALLTLVGAIGFLVAHTVLLASVALFVIGFGAAGLYPIAKAEAYARQPGRSGTVRAVIGLGTPFEIALPGIVGLIADRSGILVAIAVLCSAPLWILLLIPRRSEK